MSNKRVVVAATKSGSGKTLITCALLNALKKRNMDVRAFKCGPDYIDPMFHKKVLNIPSKNLDLFFTNEDKTRQVFMEENESDISVIEGVMGLYDGVGGITKTASTYHLAKTLNAPIILVINVHGMALSVVAEIAGFLSMDTEKLIKGVILNCTSEGFYNNIKPVIEEKFDIEVLGYYKKLKDVNLESRHLGLKLPGEIKNLQEMCDKAADALKESVRVDGILEIASNAGDIYELKKDNLSGNHNRKFDEKVRIGVALDEAFSFYYEDNFKLLEKNGVEIVPFSPLHDERIPDDISGLILGGGYPELFLNELSRNVSMKESLKRAIDEGMPSLAECGGFMYLHKTIEDEAGVKYEMVNAVEGNCMYKAKLVRFGYVSLKEKYDNIFLEDAMEIRGHEFHYYDSDNNGECAIATKPVTNKMWECAHISDNHWWGFAHLYYNSCEKFVESFVKKCRDFR